MTHSKYSVVQKFLNGKFSLVERVKESDKLYLSKLVSRFRLLNFVDVLVSDLLY